MEKRQRTLPGFEELVIEEDHISPQEARRISAAARRAFEDLLQQREDLGPLGDGFFRYCAQGWNWRKALYIAWAQLPIKGRWPATHEGLATAMGLRSARVIRKWRAQNPEIGGLIKEAFVGRVLKRAADILLAAEEVALGEGYKGFRDRQMLLEIAGVYRKEQAIELSTSLINADDMAAAARQAEVDVGEWERERWGVGGGGEGERGEGGTGG